MSKYTDNQRIPLFGDRMLVIDCVMIQSMFGENDLEPYTYYNYHIEDNLGNVQVQDCSVPASTIDNIVNKQRR